MLKIRLFFKKRRLIYVCIIVGTLIVATIISAITGISTANTWLGAISATIIFLSIAKILHDIIKTEPLPHPIPTILEVLISFIIIAIVVANVTFFACGGVF